MADPLLTSLCSICHISAPKYTCPRCAIRTCSLPCTKKHKAWSECSGKRDQAAFVSRSNLRTPAGIDHDYNFLHGIERRLERSERVIISDKALVQEEELRPLTVREVKWKPGRDGRKRKVVVTRVLREAKGRTFDRNLTARLKKLNIQIVCVSKGMTRQKENHTTLNRRSGRINWQVEWLTVGDTPRNGENDEASKSTRLLSKAMEDVCLYDAYQQALLEGQAMRDGGQTKKAGSGGRGASAQHPFNSYWMMVESTMQDPSQATWVSHTGSEVKTWPSEREELMQKVQFFLAKLPRKTNEQNVVTQVSSKDCLRDILSDTKVFEFPAIYVLHDGEELPSGFVLGPKDTILPQGTKRKDAPGTKKGGQTAKKRRRREDDLEEGEIGKVYDDDDDKSDDGRDGNGPQLESIGLEVGEVIAEESFGEDSDSSDSSSSSSSDSDSD